MDSFVVSLEDTNYICIFLQLTVCSQLQLPASFACILLTIVRKKNPKSILSISIFIYILNKASNICSINTKHSAMIILPTDTSFCTLTLKSRQNNMEKIWICTCLHTSEHHKTPPVDHMTWWVFLPLHKQWAEASVLGLSICTYTPFL